MKKLTPEIIECLKQEQLNYKSSTEMANVFGVSPSQITRIINGKTIFLRDDTWAKIEMKIRGKICLSKCKDCPLNETCELQRILEKLSRVKDISEYEKINEFIDKNLKLQG